MKDMITRARPWTRSKELVAENTEFSGGPFLPTLIELVDYVLNIDSLNAKPNERNRD